jgi:hypothetical protein
LHSLIHETYSVFPIDVSDVAWLSAGPDRSDGLGLTAILNQSDPGGFVASATLPGSDPHAAPV